MAENHIARLGLGTVQFGLDYGISNPNGRTPQKEVEKILHCASENGIKTIDTAHLYGESEKTLGQTMPPNANFDIVTKTLPIKTETITQQNIKIVQDAFYKSLQRFKRQNVYGLLLHHADDLQSRNGEALYNFLSQLKKDEKISKIGASVYDQNQIEFILNNYPIDLIQIPVNIFDQRLLKSGTLQKLAQHNIEIHVRSAFLQGVIFMPPESLPKHLAGLAPYLKRFHDYVLDLNTTPLALALAFLVQQSGLHKIICGVNSLDHFQTLVNTVSTLPDIDNSLFSSLSVDNPVLVNPALWT